MDLGGLLSPFSLHPPAPPFLGPASSLASIRHPVPVPNPAVLGPGGEHSPDCRSVS